MVKRLSSV